MPDIPDSAQVDALLASAAQDVLETMFFATICGRSSEWAPQDQVCVTVKLPFHGTPSGALQLTAPMAVIRSIAVAFLGAEDEDSVDDSQVRAVAGELANVVCGAALSRIESATTFALDAPEVTESTLNEARPASARVLFDLDCGPIAAELEFEEA
ncbi:MAG: chemotaxis protein CheX [Bryobacteraceae bacterium]